MIRYKQNGTVNTVLDNNNWFDYVYPVNSLYWTVDSRNPKDIFGGKGEWERVNGILYALSDPTNKSNLDNTISSIVGDMKVNGSYNYKGITIDKDNLPRHTHQFVHYHTRGTMNITGTFSAQTAETNKTKSGAFYHTGENTKCDSGTSSGRHPNGFGFDASKSWIGKTSDPVDSSGSKNYDTSENNSANKPINWMPPLTYVYCWKRVK